MMFKTIVTSDNFMNKFVNKTQLLLSLPVLSCCFARTGMATTQNSKTRTPKNSDPSVSTTKTQGPFTRCFFVTGTDRTSDLKLLRLVRMRFRPCIKRQWMNPYYFCVSSKEENTNFECNECNVSGNSGKC